MASKEAVLSLSAKEKQILKENEKDKKDSKRWRCFIISFAIINILLLLILLFVIALSIKAGK